MAPFLYFDSNYDIAGLNFVEIFNIITYIATYVAIRTQEGHTCKGVRLYKRRSSMQCIGTGICINIIIETVLICGVIFYSGAADNGTLMRRDGGNSCFCSLHTGEKSARAIGKDLFNI